MQEAEQIAYSNLNLSFLMTDLLLQEAEQAVLPAAREGRHPHQQEEQRQDPHAG